MLGLTMVSFFSFSQTDCTIHSKSNDLELGMAFFNSTKFCYNEK